MKKFTAMFLVFSLVILSGNLHAKERRGADLVITKKDGQQVTGELIAVKENSLLLKERESGGDVTIDIADIRIIRIVRGFGSGFRLGAGLGAGMVLLSVAEGSIEGGTSIANVSIKGLVWSLLFGLIGGGISSADKIIQIEGKSDSEIKEALEELRKKARIRDYK